MSTDFRNCSIPEQKVRERAYEIYTLRKGSRRQRLAHCRSRVEGIESQGSRSFVCGEIALRRVKFQAVSSFRTLA